MASTGTTIQTEINRLKKAKSDIKTAIINKGGTISDTATIDTYASAIDGISTGGGVPVVEIELPDIYSMENFGDVIYPGGINFEIPAEKAAILDKNPCAIIASKVTGFDYDYDYFLPLTSNEWYKVLYDASNASEVTSNILTLRRPRKDMHMSMSIILKAINVVKFVNNQESSEPLTRYLVPTIKAVYDEINKTK